MSAILPASLAALVSYYTLLWRSPCISISLLLFAGQSRVLTAWYKVFKWLQRVLLQQGSELSRLARSGGEVVDNNDGLEREGDDDPDRSEGDDEIRLLNNQSRRERQSEIYAKWRTGECITRVRLNILLIPALLTGLTRLQHQPLAYPPGELTQSLQC